MATGAFSRWSWANPCLFSSARSLVHHTPPTMRSLLLRALLLASAGACALAQPEGMRFANSGGGRSHRHSCKTSRRCSNVCLPMHSFVLQQSCSCS